MTDFTTRTLTAGEPLFAAGAPADRLYVVKSGSVQLCDAATGQPFARVGAGESFGEQALLPGGLRTAAASAAEPTVLLEISADSLKALMRRQSPLLVPVLEALLLQQSMHNALRMSVTRDS